MMYSKISLRRKNLKWSLPIFRIPYVCQFRCWHGEYEGDFFTVEISLLLRACYNAENLLQRASCTQIDAFAPLQSASCHFQLFN